MNEIIKQIESISSTLAYIKGKYDLNANPSMNLLWWKYHEERRGLITACAHLGLIVEATDTEGLCWGVRVGNMFA